MLSREIEEILEALWSVAEQQGEASVSSLTSPHQVQPLINSSEMQEALEEAEERKLITNSAGILQLTVKGHVTAQDVVRRHRLAERLFHDVLDLDSTEAEPHACSFEHLLSHDATDSICILLGHPSTCPHGNPIPSGECCRKTIADARPLVMPTTWLKEGEEATVAYLSTQGKARLEQMAVLGILPGSKITLLQRHPTYVLQVDETTVALDGDIAQEIYVRRSTTAGQKPNEPQRGNIWHMWHRWRHRQGSKTP